MKNQENTKKQILVLGGTGKTGSRVVSKLQQLGWPVRIGSRNAAIPFDWNDQSTWAPVLQGIDSVYANWRGVVGPKGLTAAQIAYWDGVFARLVQVPEWREELARLLQDPVYLNSRETKAYLDAQHQELRAVLIDLGLAK